MGENSDKANVLNKREEANKKNIHQTIKGADGNFCN